MANNNTSVHVYIIALYIRRFEGAYLLYKITGIMMTIIIAVMKSAAATPQAISMPPPIYTSEH